MTEIIADYPPNIEQIRYYLDPPSWSVYAYDTTIYAPNQKELYPDIVHHEEVHLSEQKKFRNAGEWWDLYLTSSSFRLEQEVMAYSAQLVWLREVERVKDKDLKTALDEMAFALSMWYSLDISIEESKTKIRLYEKEKEI